ncbi:MAG: tyrosine--tRNA ligase [Gemmatimonadetes bacterium]|nr:tyrosine--tRNA ligase [Gemmatimonadota bacterium]
MQDSRDVTGGTASFPPLNEQLDLIRRGTEQILPEEDLERKLARALESGVPLIVKQGFDPTRPDLHIGHAVTLHKLRDFQDLGHRVVFLIGDFTAMIGDPSGRSETRPPLTREEVEANAATYREQVFRILDAGRTEVRRNSQWCSTLDFAAVIRLAGMVTVARMLEREDFARRYGDGRPIALHEFLYPLVQGYDSVMLGSDVELGGTDQTFNLLMARDVQRHFGLEPQVAVTMPLLEGTDGVQKMSKTADNAIGITEPPEEMYGKTLSIPDELIPRWTELLTRMPAAEIADIRRQLSERVVNPRDLKRRLARDLVRQYHGDEACGEAEAAFDRLFVRHEWPEEMPARRLDVASLSSYDDATDTVLLAQALHAAGLVESYSDGLRMIQQGAVTLDGERATEERARLACSRSWKVRVGKRRFAEIRFARSG